MNDKPNHTETIYLDRVVGEFYTQDDMDSGEVNMAAVEEVVALARHDKGAGPLETWMGGYLISDDRTDPLMMPEHLVEFEHGRWVIDHDSAYDLIAAAIAKILEANDHAQKLR